MQKNKRGEKTSHIPVILATARAAKEDKIEGLDTGADDYMPKPFDADILLARVKNLLEQRKLLRERFSKESDLDLLKTNLKSKDEKFIKKVLDLIEKYLSDSGFTVSHFSK